MQFTPQNLHTKRKNVLGHLVRVGPRYALPASIVGNEKRSATPGGPQTEHLLVQIFISRNLDATSQTDVIFALLASGRLVPLHPANLYGRRYHVRQKHEG